MYRPLRPNKPNINGPSRDAINKAFGISGKGPVWVAGLVMNAPQPSSQPSVSPTPTPTTTTTPTVTPTTTSTPSPTPTISVTPTITSTSTTTPTPTNTPTTSVTPSITPTTTVTPTLTSSPTPSPLVSSITYITSGGDDNNQQTYTFNGANIGGPGLIVVTVQCDTLNPGSISSVSIGGTNGTIAVQRTESDSLISGIASRRITAGTSTNIVVTLSGNIGVACRIGVYRLQNISSDTVNLTNTGGGSGTSASASLTSLGANACVVSSIILQGTSAITWTGPTEDYDVNQESVRMSSASIKRTESGTFGISAAWGSSHTYSIASAAWI
jgi:hypothetical protein